MPVFAVLLIIAVTVCINAFVTAFLMVRFQQSEKNIRRLKLETDVITRDVNRATEAHVALAQAAVEQLEQAIAEYKALSKKDKKVSGGLGAKNRGSMESGAQSRTKIHAIPLASKPARAPKTSSSGMSARTTLRLADDAKSPVNVGNMPQNAHQDEQQNVQQQILQMLREGRSEDEIQKIYNISKAEIALARFMQSARRQS